MEQAPEPFTNVYSHLYEDVDECTTGVDNCEHNCHNTNGSYTCMCGQGFRLHSDGQQCDGGLNTGQIFPLCYLLSLSDINECIAGTDNCSDICSNTIGSYTCGCLDGYRLLSDGLTCQG